MGSEMCIRDRRMPENDGERRVARGLSGLGAAGHRAEIFMQAAQQVDQHLALVLVQTRQQAPFALECRDDHLVMDRAALRRQRDRMGAPVVGIGADRDQPPLFQAGQRPTHRALVETDDVADARGGNAGLCLLYTSDAADE